MKLNKVISRIKVVPRFIRRRTDAERFGITKFMEFAAKKVSSSDRVLDAGAGSSPYKKMFSHAKYESTDFADVFNKASKGSHDFVCDLGDIPKPDDYYDAIICTQVLEHIEEPQKPINEFIRVLKPGGKLFLTAPQGWGLHGEPYHFFNFTKYGLRSLFERAGFEIVFIEPRGGMFWYLGKRIRTCNSYIMNQYRNWKQSQGREKYNKMLIAILLFPFYIVGIPLCGILIPFLFFYLDRLDRQKSYTLGYSCYCRKHEGNN